ncbi:bifunctional SulP family inorganic anion transporter/carbonic anhydrase [Roseimaritima sediminicola]|uniref:bifunctional SulP family inorganic anion transporter/carbonic anhydrase n=1 Tax=Roseimaritima sediminicola TaxID=2662066 RepID=UPI0012985834|nr:SulP family inorganic anion transporter [Roseimaritima sediminicola]
MTSTTTSPTTKNEFSLLSPSNWVRDLVSGTVVFLVALPLCLGIALASGAPLFSGLVTGIVGGLIVGVLSGSHTSVSGPAAGLTAIVAAQIALLGSFEAFLAAVFIGGLIQIGFGIARGGALSAFFPSSVVKGLLAAIGVILILKQTPHLVGHDSDPEGEMSFNQPDQENTFSELWTVFQTLIQGDVQLGAIVIGLLSVAVLVTWNRSKFLQKLVIPGPLVVVLMGVGLTILFRALGGQWFLGGDHLVQVPVAESVREFLNFREQPDFSVWNRPEVYIAGFTIAIVASLETLLNLEAVDKLDKFQRKSPASRELIAQGVGNTVCGLIGGLPMTSVIIRSSVNVNSGSRTKLSAIFHGFLLLVCVAFFPYYLNLIPLSALAAILIVTGFKLASPQLFKQMWNEGRYQFIPFIVTLVSIVFTDLLIGILIGLAVSVLFILNSNLRRPIRRIVETHIDGDVTHIELSNQVSFLNRAALDRLFHSMPRGSSLLIDATQSDYIDPDVLSLIRNFKENVGPAHDIKVSLRGFRDKYSLQDEVQFADYCTRELQDKLTPDEALRILQEGNRRFVSGDRLSRDFGTQVHATAQEQNPLAVVLSCIDSRVPAELVFDVGLGDIFSVRVAGNVVGTKSLGSIEYGVGVAGVKLVVVLGHTRCGAVTSSVELVSKNLSANGETGCQHLQAIVEEIAPSVPELADGQLDRLSASEREDVVDEVARRNVEHTVEAIVNRSNVIRSAVEAGRLRVVGALYDVKNGQIEFFETAAVETADTLTGN